MSFTRRAALIIVLLLPVPSPATAGSLHMAFKDGYVTINATDVPLRQVLSEWARLGGTRVVNIEKLGGGPLTLELARVPEKQALEIILRGVPGYLVALRAATMPGSSLFDRIVLMPGTITPPSRAAAPPPPPPPMQQPQMPAMAVEDQDEPVREAPEQTDGAEQEQQQQQQQRQPLQQQLMPQPGFRPVPPNQNQQGQAEDDGVEQPPPGPVLVPSQGAVVSPTPGQLPAPDPQKPQPRDEDQDQ